MRMALGTYTLPPNLPFDTGVLLSLPKWARSDCTVTRPKGIAGNNYKLYNEMGFTVGERDHKLCYNRIRVCCSVITSYHHFLSFSDIPLPSDLFMRTASVRSSTISSNLDIKIPNCLVKSMLRFVLYP